MSTRIVLVYLQNSASIKPEASPQRVIFLCFIVSQMLKSCYNMSGFLLRGLILIGPALSPLLYLNLRPTTSHPLCILLAAQIAKSSASVRARFSFALVWTFAVQMCSRVTSADAAQAPEANLASSADRSEILKRSCATMREGM